MRRALCSAALAAGLAACSPSETQTDGVDATTSVYVVRAEAVVDEHGRSEAITVPVGLGGGALAIRVSAGDAPEIPGVCFQIDDVRDAAGAVWVPPALTHADWGPYCTTCAQRVSRGHGYGRFVFPNNGDPLPAVESTQIRVALRDCATGLPLDPAFNAAIPATVRVESRRTKAPPPAARGRIALYFAFASGTQFQAATAASDPTLVAAEAEVAATFDAAAIDVTVAGGADFTAGATALTWSDADRAPLDAMYGEAAKARGENGGDPAAILVVFAPCMIQKDTLTGVPAQLDGFTAHLPGGDGLGGHADGIFMKAAGCGAGAAPTYWPDGALLGKVLSHELGHALGLYHSVEAGGGVDHLDDTDADNLMNSAPLLAASSGLSSRQIRVLRGHPGVSYSMIP